MIRCDWAAKGNDLMRLYHDEEWGVPVHDDLHHFEHLALETAQAGLSWAVVLNKREAYRRAFANFDAEKIARFTPARVEKLLQNAGIIRNRAKINAMVTNARAFLAVRDEFGSFDRFLWGFVDGRPIKNTWKVQTDLPARTTISDALSIELKRRGFKFVGSVVCYAHMQAVGLINDHLITCFRYRPCAALARKS
ncbi:MAG TPA: DNA-3-methyladenine glycosylase I [Pirellulaceae bacterium]